MFYADWCPHCVHFAPRYKKIVENSKVHNNMIFAAVNCAADQFQEACRNQKVEFYPTLKLFGLQHYDEDHPEKYLSPHPKTMSRARVDAQNSDSTGVFQGMMVDNQFGNDEKMISWMEVYAALHSGHEANINTMHESSAVVSQIKGRDYLFVKPFNFGWDKETAGAGNGGARYHDMLMALHYAFSQGVSVEGATDKERMEDYSEMLKFMGQHLPDHNNSLSMISAAEATVDRQAEEEQKQKNLLVLQASEDELKQKKEALENDEIDDLKKILADKWPVDVAKMKADAGTPKYDVLSFTGGLWNVFHTLAQYSKNGKETVRFLRLFVKNFFLCEVCREHFLRDSPAYLDSVETPEELQIALWKFHNIVSVRLSVENNKMLSKLGPE